jgi:hypothetical protein
MIIFSFIPFSALNFIIWFKIIFAFPFLIFYLFPAYYFILSEVKFSFMKPEQRNRVLAWHNQVREISLHINLKALISNWSQIINFNAYLFIYLLDQFVLSTLFFSCEMLFWIVWINDYFFLFVLVNHFGLLENRFLLFLKSPILLATYF